MKTVQTEVPQQLYAQRRSLVALGWFQDEGDVIREALRRFLEVHKADIMDEFVRKDVEWGLGGRDLTLLSSSVTRDR
jgi:Arc/MetJ-type ribon-helix-helix transcriptional regulator